jgi:hypothetical protein
MKTTSYIVAFTLCAAAKAMALDQLEQNHGAVPAAKLEVHSVFTASPFAQAKEIKGEGKIDRVGGMSSQPWSQIAARNSGAPSTLTDMQNQECGLPLFSIGARPHPWYGD